MKSNYYVVTVFLITEKDEAELAIDFADALDFESLGATEYGYAVDAALEVDVGEDGKISRVKETT